MTAADDDDDDAVPAVIRDLRSALSRSVLAATSPPSLFDPNAVAVPVAAMAALLGVVKRSRAGTMMGLQDELQRAVRELLAHQEPSPSASCEEDTHGGADSKETVKQRRSRRRHHPRSSIALRSGCELFLKYITRTFLELPDFESCRSAVLERGQRFQLLSLASRDRIARAGRDFVAPNSTVLTLGWSRVVAAILLEASRTKHFDLVVLRGHPGDSGLRAAECYARETSIPVTVVPDAAMAAVLERADAVLVGAEGVLENGGIVNEVGTCPLAVCAQSAGKPVYVAAESYKFARWYPLRQSDLPCYDESGDASSSAHAFTTTANGSEGEAGEMPSEGEGATATKNWVRMEVPPVDFTPSQFITLLFTDLGVLTPSAVSDELIRLYQ
jgi:translation initiation factor eIF-2B subunit alpha